MCKNFNDASRKEHQKFFCIYVGDNKLILYKLNN